MYERPAWRHWFDPGDGPKVAQSEAGGGFRRDLRLLVQVAVGHAQPLEDPAGSAVDDVREPGVHQRADVPARFAVEADVDAERGDELVRHAVGRAERRARPSRGTASATADVRDLADVAAEAGRRPRPGARRAGGGDARLRRGDRPDRTAVDAADDEHLAWSTAVLVGADQEIVLAVAVDVARVDEPDPEVAPGRRVRAVDLGDGVGPWQSGPGRRSDGSGGGEHDNEDGGANH